MEPSSPYVAETITRLPKRAMRTIFVPVIVGCYWTPFHSHQGRTLWQDAFEALAVALFLIAIYSRGGSLRRDFQRVSRDFSWTPLVGLIIAASLMVVCTFSVVVHQHYYLDVMGSDGAWRQPSAWMWCHTISSFTVVPLFEELVFRGLMMRTTRFAHPRRNRDGLVTIIASALWWSVGHTSANRWETILIGITFGLVLRRTHNLAFSIATHATWNFICSLPFFLYLVVPHYRGWSGLVSAEHYHLARTLCLCGSIALYALIAIPLVRITRHRRSAPRRVPTPTLGLAA